MKKWLTILFLGLGLCAYGQNVTIKGTVVGTDSNPMPGVNVVEKGTYNATATDMNGEFTLTVPVGSVLQCSFIGYIPKEVTVTGAGSVRIVLEEDSAVIEDVVVVGYGVQKKKLFTGATVQVKGDDIAKMNTVNPLGALQSKTPGVNITQNGGFLDQGFKVNIRGMGTVGDYAPLYVVDGVPNGSLSSLNAADIESIDVLKDAASAAIYGARAANGVILITTKKGKAGTGEVSYDAYYGIQNLYKIPNVLTAQEYMNIIDESRVMDGLEPYSWETYIPAKDLEAVRSGAWKGTNWLKEMQNENAPIQSHALNITGGTERSTYSIGLGWSQQRATIGVPNAMPTLSRWNLRINTDNVVLKRGDLDLLRVGETLNYRYSFQKGSFSTGGIYWNHLRTALIRSPLMHVYNSEGDYYLWEDQKADGYNWDIANGSNSNPLASLDWTANQNRSKSHYLQTSFYAVLQPIRDLLIRTQVGYMMGASSYRSFTPQHDKLTESDSGEINSVTQSMSVYNRWTWDNTINYKFTVQDNHAIDVLVGQSVERWGYGESMSASNSELQFNDLEHAYLSNANRTSNVPKPTGTPSGEGAIASFFARLNYNFKERYMATVIMRADGSSVFAPGNRWGYFPSVSAGWVISNEPFMEGVRGIDLLKLRASWGQNGNCNVSGNQWIATITTNQGYGGYTFGDSMDVISSGSYAYKVLNPDLKWETSEQLNIGVDAQFFNSRFKVEFDWYRKLTKDWLVTPPVLMSWGANAPSINGGEVKNSGVELGLHWNDNVGKDFWYGVDLNLAYNRNRITYIDNADGIIHGPGSVFWEDAEECFRASVGRPIGYFYGYISDGIFQNQAQIDAYTGAKLNGDNTAPGDVIWRDVDNSGTIDANDRTMIGDPNPDVTMGFSFNIGWKGIDLGVTTYGAFGHQILKCYRDFTASPLSNFTTDIYARWHGEGTSNTMPRLSSASSSNWNRISTIYMEDGDYLKIKNITVGFDFKKFFPKIPFGQLRGYFSAQNLYTFTGYSAMDPEIGYGSDYGWASGIDLGYYPSARTYMIGLNIKFN